MADTYKLLYQGQLSSVAATLVTVGATEQWIVKHMTVVNNDTASRTFALYRQGSAASNIITPPNLSVPAGGMAEWDGTLAMSSAETLVGSGSVGSQLTLTVSGDKVT